MILRWPANIRRPAMVLAALVLPPLLFGVDDPQREAAALVDEGLEHFRNDQFADAETSFAAALELVPENDVVLFDKGCAALSAGNRDAARSLFRSVTVTRDRAMAGRAHYNLGSLESAAARELLGDDPAAAQGEVRTQSIELLRAAALQFRSALQRDPQNSEARHNLELIVLYMKHLQAQWKERDQQKNRDEKDLLQFLKMIEDRQRELRTTSRSLTDEESSAAAVPTRFARQAAWETAVELRALQEEMDPLKQKISAEVTASAADDEDQSPERLLHEIVDRIGAQLLQAAEEIESRQGQQSIESQTAGLALTNELYTAIAPYPALLQRAIRTQSRWLPAQSSVPGAAAPSAGSDQGDATSDATSDETDQASGEEPRDNQPATPTGPLTGGAVSPDHREDQQRVSLWSSALKFKAEAGLPQIEQQLQQLPPVADAPEAANAGDDSQERAGEENTAADADEEQDAAAVGQPAEDRAAAQREQLQGLAESMRQALDLAPQAAAESRLAETDLSSEAIAAAVPHQKSTLRILEEIAAPLRDDSTDDRQNQEQNEDQNQNESDEDSEGEERPQDGDQQQDPQQNSPDDQDTGDRDQQQDSPQPSDSGKQESDASSQDREQQQQESRRQRAESILRQAAEREREYREQQKRIRALLQRGIKVDRDW